MTTLFERLELGSYEPVHTRDLGEESKITWPHVQVLINETIAAFGLRPDILFMHGQERVEYFYDDALKEKVRNSWWKKDVEMFAEYA